ncbi:MAG: L-aspartate oxidase [Flavobacteriaceae bacterium]|nr:L-aspartate oxidase [Flavobacteriaceae bacterium]MCY4267130.1 L-aspartate oxidase [Flavobacteriaceae bacterium]
MVYDILVIGTGISGLTFAIKVSEQNPNINVALISKGELDEGNTRYAQGGIAVVKDFVRDSFEKHIEDTLEAGGFQNKKKVIEFVVREGGQRIDELLQWGIQFDTQNGQLHLTKEAGHSANRIIHHKDITGYEIQQALVKKVQKIPNVTCLKNHTLVDLITDHHVQSNYNRCYGAYVISKEQKQIITLGAKLTVLSTGGAGQLYRHTTNPPESTGDGLGAAYRAKVYMENLPFVQFHPTGLFPKVEGRTFLISEVLRGIGAKLLNEKGIEFMSQYHRDKELAPRDVVARGIASEIQKGTHDYVYLDAQNISFKKWLKRLPNIYQKLISIGINPLKEYIPVVPVAHYFCGGIVVDEHAESELKGLYAVGECSSTGLHGANRLASNSLLESIVFSHRAAMHCLASLNEPLPPNMVYEKIPKWKGKEYQEFNNPEITQSLRLKLQDTMTNHVSIFKTNRILDIAEKEMNHIYTEVLKIYNRNKLDVELCELRNMVSIAHLIIQQAKKINTNQGVFYNIDNE